jgi:hypothetical protein
VTAVQLDTAVTSSCFIFGGLCNVCSVGTTLYVFVCGLAVLSGVLLLDYVY